MVVNGISHNYLDVAEDYGLNLHSECDSEVILRLVEAAEHPAVGLEACLRELRGGMAAAALDTERQIVWLARNEARPLWLIRLGGIEGFFFSSTENIALAAMRRVYGRTTTSLLQVLVPLAPQTVTGISSDGKWITAMDAPQPRRRSVERGLRIS